MQENSKKLWFKAKRYGWGWYPSAWQGWLVLLAYLAVIFAAVAWLEKNLALAPTNSTLVKYLALVAAATSILIWICWKTGEKPRWRWGGKD